MVFLYPPLGQPGVLGSQVAVSKAVEYYSLPETLHSSREWRYPSCSRGRYRSRVPLTRTVLAREFKHAL